MSHEILTNRVNLVIPLDMSIQIEKEIEKRGIQRAQYIREAIHEKLKNSDTSVSDQLKEIKGEIKEIKHFAVSALDILQTLKRLETD